MISHRAQQGELLLDQGRFQQALECFDTPEGEPADRDCLFGRAVALQMLRRPEEAEAAYEHLLSLDPSHQEALSNLITMNVERFALERVHTYAVRLLEINRQSTTALQGLIVVAIERRQYELAASYLERLHLQPAEVPPIVEYRLSREMVQKLRSTHVPVARSY